MFPKTRAELQLFMKSEKGSIPGKIDPMCSVFLSWNNKGLFYEHFDIVIKEPFHHIFTEKVSLSIKNCAFSQSHPAMLFWFCTFSSIL